MNGGTGSAQVFHCSACVYVGGFTVVTCTAMLPKLATRLASVRQLETSSFNANTQEDARSLQKYSVMRTKVSMLGGSEFPLDFHCGT
jgi:hypothetical protein